MKRIVCAFFALLLILSFSACITDYENNVAAIELQANSFKDVYDVDEELNLDTIILAVKYKSGQQVILACSKDMVVGFDTKTTGDKSLHVAYKDVKSAVWEYKVVNKGNETVSISTSCRLAVFSEVSPNAASYSISINNGDIANIKGIIFTIKSVSDLGVSVDKSNLEITNLPSGWIAEGSRTDKNTLKILVYKVSGMDISSTLSFATVNILAQQRVNITINNITVTDGEKEYYLPNIK